MVPHRLRWDLAKKGRRIYNRLDGYTNFVTFCYLNQPIQICKFMQ